MLMGTAAVGGALARVTDPPASEGYAAVPGGKVYWRRFGSGGKTPLLMLHGGPGAAHNYLLSMKALADERPVVFYDQLGCGRSDAPTYESLYTIQRSIDEVDAVRQALGLSLARFVQGGVKPTSTNALLSELHRTWARPEAADLAQLYGLVAPNYAAVIESYVRAQQAVKIPV
ncbi:alpha/beta fold hydrolase [Allosphingosinicella deserti]|uniref:AB hydrolase-1 domain-containing protein n=1 Tax=Allosphingosinicella deserti TaxID=2116704 RepID=A0A2P7QLM1_9SPHN|nr:alpha/beta fold hydrolase [Sphingomonas deserti]PSJ38866.1 hypothetical protein C7I55_16190 [Sphingomonas deserti]